MRPRSRATGTPADVHQGNRDYQYQCEHYGHPSKVGFKDIDHIWHAENWDPEKLMDLYQKAGAKYFMALAQHHDNFDCWDSKYQPWNSVALGPKKDIVGTWAEVARQRGMRFGVSSHGSAPGAGTSRRRARTRRGRWRASRMTAI